jgi:RNA polymerase sigma-70 factor (ECF subfamily)
MSRPASRAVRPCLKRLGRLSAYLDRELPPEACEEIQKHMAGCADCRAVLKTLKKTIALCRRAPGKHLSRAAMNRVLRAISKETRR